MTKNALSEQCFPEMPLYVTYELHFIRIDTLETRNESLNRNLWQGMIVLHAIYQHYLLLLLIGGCTVISADDLFDTDMISASLASFENRVTKTDKSFPDIAQTKIGLPGTRGVGTDASSNRLW